MAESREETVAVWTVEIHESATRSEHLELLRLAKTEYTAHKKAVQIVLVHVVYKVQSGSASVNTVSCETATEDGESHIRIPKYDELGLFRNHASQLAAIDYMLSLDAHTFLPTYPGNMARLVEGHRRFLGHKKTILPNAKSVVRLIDSYQSGNSSWTEVVDGVYRSHVKRMGAPKTRHRNAKNPKAEDNFYQNPIECMCLPLDVATPIE